MVAIGSGTSSATTRDNNSVPVAAGATRGPVAASATTPATAITLSDRAKAIIAKAQADKEATSNLTDSFDEMLSKRTDALADRLSAIFAKLNVPPEYTTHMKVDRFGNVTAEGPWKAKIEKMFSENPDLAKELKDVSGLSSLKAAQASLDLFNAQKKATSDEDKRAKAWTDYNIRSMNIQTLSGVMTMKDGKLRSAAVDYMDMVTDPTGIASGASRQNVADRLV
jgi:hypothetical protein